MKRFMIFALIAALLIASSYASAEDEAVLPLPELMQALRDAGRETENIFAYDVYMNGDTPETAAFLVQAGDTAQLTVLEAGEDGAWHITGRNDTIPASFITRAALETYTLFDEEYVKLELHKYIPSYAFHVPDTELYYLSLDFRRTPEGDWMLDFVRDIPTEEAEEGRCPCHILAYRDDGWEFYFSEDIMDENGWWGDSSETILKKVVPTEEMTPYTDLSQIEVPAFLSYLHAMAPTEYEHAPRNGPDIALPLVTPVFYPDDPERKAPDDVYYNPEGGVYYHADPECPSVSPKYLPLVRIPDDELGSARFMYLQPCPFCVMTHSPSQNPVPTDSPSSSPATMDASSSVYAEDDIVMPLPELMQALRDAGRETENILAYDVYMNGDTPETAVFLVQAGDTAQLTVLEAGEDGVWHITGRNDTIPASIITDAGLDLMDGPVSAHTHSGREWIKLETKKYIPLYSIGEANIMLGYFSLDFQRTSEGNWTLCLVCDIPFEETEERRCPYHMLGFTDGSWEYRFYEEIMDDAGRWDRSEMILRKTVPAEEMSPYTEMSKLDVPAFLAFLRKLVPQEYEHAQRHSDTATVPPTAAPASVSDDPAGKGQDTVYYNPMGGRYYHADSECSSAAPAYRPLTPIPADELNSERFRVLQPCPHCAMPGSTSPSPAPTDAPSGTNAEKAS